MNIFYLDRFLRNKMASSGVYEYVEVVGGEQSRVYMDGSAPICLNSSFYGAELNFYHALIGQVGGGSGVVHENLVSDVVCSVVGGRVILMNTDSSNPKSGIVHVYVGSGSSATPTNVTASIFNYRYYMRPSEIREIDIPECRLFSIKSGDNLYLSISGSVSSSSWVNIRVDS